jgi:hypothetical protein
LFDEFSLLEIVRISIDLKINFLTSLFNFKMFQTYLGETSASTPAPTPTPVPAPASTPAPVPAAAPVDGDLIRQAINEAMRHFPVIKKFLI